MLTYRVFGLSPKDSEACAAEAAGWHSKEPRGMPLEETTVMFKWKKLVRRLRTLVPADELLNWEPVMQCRSQPESRPA